MSRDSQGRPRFKNIAASHICCLIFVFVAVSVAVAVVVVVVVVLKCLCHLQVNLNTLLFVLLTEQEGILNPSVVRIVVGFFDKTGSVNKTNFNVTADKNNFIEVKMDDFHQTDDGKVLNPNQKPYGLMEDIIKTFSREGDTILDALEQVCSIVLTILCTVQLCMLSIKIKYMCVLSHTNTTSMHMNKTCPGCFILESKFG